MVARRRCLAPPANKASGALQQAGDEGGVCGLAADTGETPRHVGQGLQGEAGGAGGKQVTLV